MPAFITRKVTFTNGQTTVTVEAPMPDSDIEEYARDLLRDFMTRDVPKLMKIDSGWGEETVTVEDGDVEFDHPKPFGGYCSACMQDDHDHCLTIGGCSCCPRLTMS